ncbi:MAG: 4-hydroxy-tetrahydrodipicolinate synthase [bacterium]
MFGRLITAMATPFKEDYSLDVKRACELVEKLIDDGSDGILVAGTTGESPTLSTEEKLTLFREIKNIVRDKSAVIAGTGNYNTKESIELTKEAESIGVDGILLVAPYYNKPSQDGLYAHFKVIAQATKLPVILYNIPSRTGVNILPSTVIRLAKDVKNIVAIKEASQSTDQAVEILRGIERDDFVVYSGDDSFTMPLMSVGGYGIISVASHIVGRKIKKMLEDFVSGNVRSAIELNKELFPIFKALFVTTNPVPLKEAMKLIGFDIGPPRLPLVRAGEKEINVIKEALRFLSLI